MTRTYKGSCHCGKVRSEADIDLGAGTCNCSICAKRRYWGAILEPEASAGHAPRLGTTSRDFLRRTGHGRLNGRLNKLTRQGEAISSAPVLQQDELHGWA